MSKNRLLDFVKDFEEIVEVALPQNPLKSIKIRSCKASKLFTALKNGSEPTYDNQVDLIVACVVEPALNEDDVLNAFKVSTAEKLVDEIFSAGEQEIIIKAALELSGLGKSLTEATKEAKK